MFRGQHTDSGYVCASKASPVISVCVPSQYALLCCRNELGVRTSVTMDCASNDWPHRLVDSHGL